MKTSFNLFDSQIVEFYQSVKHRTYLLMIFLIFLMTAQQNVWATTITVGTPATCTLRDAITAINNSANSGSCTFPTGGDTISLPIGTHDFTGIGAVTITRTGVTIKIIGQGTRNNTTINRVHGSGNNHFIEIDNGAEVEIGNLTMTNGKSGTVGAIRVLSGGKLTVKNSRFHGNNG
jgi:hypothetical protein